MAEVILKGGAVALISEEDLQLVASKKWYLSSNGYAVRTVHISGNKKDGVVQRRESMHRLILGAKEGEQVDHINRDRLDNRRENLRIATHTQNTWNTVKKVSAAGFIGVKQESENVFCARIGKDVVGYYPTAELAAQARDLEALNRRGEYAVLNFKKEDLPDVVEALPPRNVGERTSTTVGVSYAKNRKALQKWRAVYKKKHLGWFLTEQEAIKALEKAKS